MFHFNGKLEGIVSGNLGCHHFNLKGDHELCSWTSFVKNEDFKAHVDGGWCPVVQDLSTRKKWTSSNVQEKSCSWKKGWLGQ